MLLYRRIRDLREDSDKTQKDIAAVLNMQVTVYQRYNDYSMSKRKKSFSQL